MRKTLLAAGFILGIVLCGAQSSSYQFNGEQGLFTENMGQVVNEQGQPVPDVLAKASITGLDIYITKTGVTYVLQKYEEDLSAKPHPVYINEKKYKIKYSRVDVALTGATLGHNQMLWTDADGWKSNYYKTADGKGLLGLEHYKTLTIQNVYPGIDWVWKFNAQNKPEYDFVVHPGADPAVIKMNYSYADLKPGNNSLTISTPLGSLTEGPLQAHCSNGKIKMAYSIDAAAKQISFAAAAYDKTKDLLIDPPLALDWTAQFGGNFLNGLRGVTEDSLGGIYLCGYTTSTNFVTDSPGGGAYYQGTFHGQTDAILLKLDTNQHLKWATYMGGPGNDFANALCYIKANDQLIITGGAQTGFPITNGPTTATGQDVFAATINRSNLQLLQANFYGGNGTDEGMKVCKINGNNFCIVGYTNSTGNSFANIIYGSGYNQTAVAGEEAFIMTFIPYLNNSNLMRPYWSTKYGGGSNDYATSVTSDSLNDLVITGYTNSTNLPVTHTGTGTPAQYFQGTNGGGNDGFIIKLDANRQLFYATYYGGSGNDYFNDVTTGITGNFLFTGRTNSPNFPIDSISGFGFNQTHLADTTDDAFIVKFDNNMALKWATYYGGNQADAGTGISTDAIGQMYVTGFTFSTNFPLDSFPGAFYQPVNAGNADGWVARFTDLGVRSWSTYKGDSCYQYPYEISYDRVFNKFYVAGEGLLACGQSLPDSVQLNGTNGSSSIGFCWAFNGQTVPPVCQGFGVGASTLRQPCPAQCNGEALASVANGHPPYTFAWSNGSTSVLDSNICPTESWLEVQDSLGCKAEINLYYTPLKLVIGNTDIVCLPGPANVQVTATGGNGAQDVYQWSTSGGVFSDSTNINVSDTGTYIVTVQDNTGCSASVSAQVGFSNVYPNGQLEVLNYPTCGQFGPGIIDLLNANTDAIYPNGNVVWTDFNYNVLATGDTFYNAQATTNNSFNYYYAIDSAYCYNGVTSPVYYLFNLPNLSSLTYFYATPPSTCTSMDGAGNVYINNPQNEIQGNNVGGTSSQNISIFGSFNVVQVSPQNINYNWSNGDYGPSITNLGDSVYSVTVSDGCGQTAYSADLILPVPQVTPVVVDGGCPNGEIDLYSGSSDLPYTFLWSNGPTTSFDRDLSAGTYVVTVTGANGCLWLDTFDITIMAGDGMQATLSSDGITCAPGTITAIATGGVGPYQFEWSTAPGGFVISNESLVSDTGNYNVTVEDANRCSVTASVEVGYNNLPVAYYDFVIEQYPSCGLSNGIVYFTGPDPSNVSWQWPNGNITYGDSITGAYTDDQGTYVVTDNSNCVNGQPLPVQYWLQLPDAFSNWNNQFNLVALTQPTGCNTENGVVGIAINNTPSVYIPFTNGNSTVTVNGYAPIKYQWSNGDSYTRYDGFYPDPYYQGQESGFNAGICSVTITDGSCVFVDSIRFSDSNPPLVANYQITNTGCVGSTSGSIHLVSLQNNPSGFFPNTFVWSNGATTSSISNLSAGTYRVTITGPNACPVIDTFVVGTSNTGLPITLSSSGITCAPGTVTATANGGTGPYQYEWSTSPGSFGDSASIFVADSGKYVVTVEDAHGCSGKDSVEVGYNNLPLVTGYMEVVRYPSCGDSNGIFKLVTPTNSQQVSWDWPGGSTTTSPIANNTYVSNTLIAEYFATDSENCINGEPYPLTYSFLGFEPGYYYYLTTWNPTNCSLNGEGMVEIDLAVPAPGLSIVDQSDNTVGFSTIIYDSLPPLLYEWSTQVGSIVNQNTTLSGGGLVTVTVFNGQCLTVLDTILPYPPVPQINPIVTPNNCNSGSINLTSTTSGGGAPYKFTWSNGDSTSVVGHLSTGTYIVTVSGANACPVIDTFQIDSGIPLVVRDSITPIACYDSSATVIITATGGKFPYTGTGTFIKPPGSYVLTVTDSNGCSSNDSIIVRPSRAQSALVVGDSFNVINCFGGYADLMIYATGGVPPYTGTGVNTVQAGFFTYPVIDSLGCRVIDTGHIPQPTQLQVSDSVGAILCYGGKAPVTLRATGGTPPYTGTGTFIESPGNYTLVVTDQRGCQGGVTVAVTGQPTPLEINITVQDTAASCRDTLSALVSASGGTPPYTGPTAVVYTHNGNYTITVTDHNGCRADSVLAVHLDTCTGIETLTAGAGVLVYPNPAASKFYVKFELPVTTETDLRLYDAAGKLVMLKSLGTGADLSEMDCSALAGGVYILNTYAAGREFYFKVVIEK